MKKPFRLIVLSLILILLSAASIKTVLYFITVDQLKSYASVDKITALFNKPPSVPQKNPQPAVKMPDIQILATQQLGAQAPAVANAQEEKQLIKQQVNAAGSWLSSSDTNQRQMGAEQLSAYPTAEAEKMLIKALADKEPAVRSAAAASFAAFNNLGNPAIVALLTALEDKNETVQASVFSTLQTLIPKEQSGSERHQLIIQELRKKESSPRLSAELRQVLHGFIEEQS